jgi:hypothetical protein
MAVVTTPSLLRGRQQQALTAAWNRAVMSGLQRARDNVARAERLGMVQPGSEPQEPDYVYGLLQAVVPTMQAELAAAFAPHGRSVVVAGVFCHQSPYVSFRVREASKWQEMACELGDLLVLVRYQESWGEELSALLLQFKMDDWPTADLTDPQWRLYAEWPPFAWNSAPYYRRKPKPQGPHAGANYAVVGGVARWGPLARAADGALRPRYLGTTLSGTTMLFGGRSIKSRTLARAEAQAGWSEVVWDLIDDTAGRLLNRTRSNAIGERRGLGTQALLDSSAGPSELLNESLIAAGAELPEIENVWGDAQSVHSEHASPAGPTPSDTDDDANDGGISLLVIEVSDDGQAEQ